MKLWGTIRKGSRIMREHTVEYEGISRGEADWFDLIGPLCHEMDLSRPVMLKKHIQEFNEFSRAVFRPDDFMESVNFDRFEVEVFYPKKK